MEINSPSYSTKTVVQLDDEGLFLGMTTVDEDQMHPGEFLLPNNAFIIEPPIIEEGRRARWANGSWSYELITVPITGNYALVKKMAPDIIDRDVDLIYQRVIGQRAQEYISAETEARSFADAGYSGVVPQTVKDWAEIKDITHKAASDNILVQANLWRQMSTSVMRKGRLLAKENVRKTANLQELNTVMLTWKATVAEWATLLGLGADFVGASA